MKNPATLITRGKIQQARIGARTLLQITGLDGEVFNNVELLLPPGYVANPVAGDVTLLEANGVRSHVIAACGDNTADTVANLQPGEFGLSAGGTRTILFRVDGIHIVDTAKIVLQAPVLQWTPDGTTFHTLATDAHTHKYNPGGGAVTDTTAPDTGLT